MLNPKNIYLGVNIDHVATLRQVRQTNYPDPVYAALLAEQAGADLITAHLREDRRHIQDQDIIDLKNQLKTKLNLEIAAVADMIAFAVKVKPQQCCLVPERREELTTEGGLDVVRNITLITKAVAQLQDAGIKVSLFVDPDQHQIEAARECQADEIEIHTGTYAEMPLRSSAQLEQLSIISSAVSFALDLGLGVNAGHGLHYHNVQPIAALPGVVELNIGHAIVARAVMTGLTEAVSTMKQLITQARS